MMWFDNSYSLTLHLHFYKSTHRKQYNVILSEFILRLKIKLPSKGQMSLLTNHMLGQ